MIDESKFAALIESAVRRVLDERESGKPATSAKDLLTIKHAAEAADCHPSTIRAMLRSGRLKRYGKGRMSRAEARRERSSVAGGASSPRGLAVVGGGG